MFPSPVFAAERCGFEVVWADIDPVTMSPGIPELEAAAESDFDVLVMQWAGGFISPAVEAIGGWCRERGIFFLEDASHAAGSLMDGKYAGQFGDAAVFSLAATKPLQTGQGGVLATNDAELQSYAFQMKNYGRTEMFQRGVFLHAGYNMHMTELQAALGNVLFDTMLNRIDERYRIADVYGPYLQEAGIRKLGDYSGRPNLYKMVIELPETVDKAKFKDAMAQRAIEMGSSIYDFIVPHVPAFQGRYEGREFPATARFAARHTCMPMHNGISVEDAHRVGRELVAVVSELS
jgi:dTDP-4-amino-4,6-dideoxygalactose transaminase